MSDELRLRCVTAGMPEDLSVAEQWTWLNDNHEVFGPSKDNHEASDYKEVPAYQRCVICWDRWGGVGRSKSWWKKGRYTCRSFICDECGHEWTARLKPSDFVINGVHYTVDELVRRDERGRKVFHEHKHEKRNGTR